MTKLLKELRGKTKVCGYSPAEVQRDIELRELRDFAGNVVYQLGSLGSQYPNLVATMQLMFSQAGLPPVPSPSASRGNSVASSARSTPSSVSGRSVSSYIKFNIFGIYGRNLNALMWSETPPHFISLEHN